MGDEESQPLPLGDVDRVEMEVVALNECHKASMDESRGDATFLLMAVLEGSSFPDLLQQAVRLQI
jgi:hypothetical protein